MDVPLSLEERTEKWRLVPTEEVTFGLGEITGQESEKAVGFLGQAWCVDVSAGCVHLGTQGHGVPVHGRQE